MIIKGVEVLLIIIIIFINDTQTGQPKKNDVTRKKPEAQGNNNAKKIPQTTRWPGDIKKNKPHSKLKTDINVQKKVFKSKSNPGNKLKTSKPQTNQRRHLPKNKPEANIEQKGNIPIKIPQTKQRNIIPKNKQENLKNNEEIIKKNKPQTKQLSNIPKNVPGIKPEDNVLKDIASKLNQGNYWPKHALPSNPWNIIPKNIPQPNPGNNAPKNLLPTNQDNKVSKHIAPLKLNQERNMPNNKSQTNPGINITKDKPQLFKEGVKKKKWNFQDYLKKFEPKTIWEQIDKQRKYNGRQISEEEQTEIMLRGIDPTDELLNLKVENGDAKMILQADARRGWKPNPGFHWFEKDRFHLRRRLYELMKQAIYQTRNKMITMQVIRDRYRRKALYKMGFLFNKADNAASAFGKFSFRAFRNCLLKREAVDPPPLFDLLSTNERQLNLWFNVEIIVDLIKKNDVICKEVFQKHKSSRNQLFDESFVD